MMNSLTLNASKVLILGALMASCGQQNNHQTPYPHTGDSGLEELVSALTSRELVQESRIYYISTDALNVRSSDAIDNNIMGRLNRNDEVRVINSSENFNGEFVQIEIVKTSSEIRETERYFVSFKYLNETKVEARVTAYKYFMIQNIATEKLRVYERSCPDNSCAHKLILETNVVVGEDGHEVKERTNLGSYRITGWRKFHEDAAQHYPSWYDPTYPEVPKPGRGFNAWLRKKYMPEIDGEKEGVMRGAFGWYASFVGPNADAQWTHGTIGWGEDKQRFIEKTKRFLTNLITAPRSAGCVRTDNETIAYLRQILPVGTPVLRVYAIEKLADPNLAKYKDQTPKYWDYILTKRGVRTDGQKSDRQEVLQSGILRSEVIEEGRYVINSTPEVIEFTDDVGRFARKLGQKGNSYGVAGEDMRGVYYVDSGLFHDYAHPQGLKVGGYEDEVIPTWVDVQNVPLK